MVINVSVVLNETTLEFAYKSEYGVFVNTSNPSVFLPVVGETYRIVWDGEEHIETAIAHDNFPGQVLMGNQLLAGGEDTKQPFAIASLENGNGMTIFALDTESTHTLAVYLVEEEQPEEPAETAGATIVLYDRTGAAVTYEGVETLTTDTPVEGEHATFTHGELLTGTEIELDMAAGDQKVRVPDGYLLKEATLKKPETMKPENIKRGVDIGGVVGEFAGDETEKTVDLDMTAGDQVIEADEGTVMARVTVKKPETLSPENIKKDVEIGGVTGAFVGDGKMKEVDLDMTAGDQVIEADEGTVMAKVTVKKPETMIPANIADGVNIGGIEGIHKDYSKEIIEGTAVSVANAQVSQIASYTFYINKVMEKADFPNCKVIGDSAFMGCSVLNDISFPNCETISGYSAFAACVKLPEAIFPKCTSLGTGYAFTRCLSLSNVEFPLCSIIPNATFSSCPKLVSVSFPECTSVASGAFYSCSGLEYVAMEKCISISNSAFYNCTKLSSCSFPNARDVHSMAFYGCTKLSQSSNYVYYVGDMAVYTSSAFSSSTCTFREGTRVLAQYICSNKSRMTSVAGLENVEVIGNCAFFSCFSARFGSFPKVKYVGFAAFSYCSSLNYADMPECEEIGGTYAFARCTSLYTANMPMIEKLPDATFMFCSKMFSASFENAKTIGSSAFQGCTSLQTMFLPKGQSIFNYAFSGCSSLSAVIIGDHKTLASYAFASCYNLVSLYLLGSSVGGSGGYMLNSTPINGYSTYAGKYGSIFVRESLLATFKAAWKTWSSRFVGMTDDEIAALYEEWGNV